MIKYGNRGKGFEDLIYRTNVEYMKKGIARVDKVATPVKVLKTLSGGKVIGFWEKKSTVDYIGIAGKSFICFDCKETKETTRFPLSNIHAHQLNYMRDVVSQGGKAFFLVHFTKLDRYFRLSYGYAVDYWREYQRTGVEKGRASIPFIDFRKEIFPTEEYALDYIDGLI